MTRAAFLVDLKLDRHLAANCGNTKGHGHGFFNRLTTLWPAIARACATRGSARATAKHRREQITESANATDIEIVERAASRLPGSGRAKAAWAR